MGRQIPPFAAIRAFEAAARHCSLLAAAEELRISPSAVSHQVRALEDIIGVKLFLRNNNRMELTEAGRLYREELCRALDLIENATAKTTNLQRGRPLTINLFASLAELWLIPQLNDFQLRYPEIDLRLLTLQEDLDFSGTDIDIAIRYAQQAPEGAFVDCLLPDSLLPVCSPSYLEREGPLTAPKDLLERRLLVCRGEQDEWTGWFSAMGVADRHSQRWLTMDNRAMVLRAASEGLGIGMARTPYADVALARGELVAPIGKPLPTGFSYYLVLPERSISIPAARTFRSWFLESCKQWQQARARQDRPLVTTP